MHLTEALAKQAYISVANDRERIAIETILSRNNIDYNPIIEHSGRFISLFSNREYNFTSSDENKYGYPTISASEFINSNIL